MIPRVVRRLEQPLQLRAFAFGTGEQVRESREARELEAVAVVAVDEIVVGISESAVIVVGGGGGVLGVC